MNIDAVTDEHGWALQAVLGDEHGAPPFTYSSARFDHVPELRCIGDTDLTLPHPRCPHGQATRSGP